MRSLSVCGRSFDCTPGGANSLLDFLFVRGKWIVRNVQRTLRYFEFDHAAKSFDGIGYLLLAAGISELFNFNSSRHGFA
jgi:hypothetical protein